MLPQPMEGDEDSGGQCLAEAPGSHSAPWGLAPVMPMAGLCPSPHPCWRHWGPKPLTGALPGRGRGPAERPGGPKKPLLIIHPEN